MTAPGYAKKWLPPLFFAAHALAYLVMALAGKIHPLEPFGILLLAANLSLAVIIRTRWDISEGLGVMFLVASHAVIGHYLAPDPLTSGAALVVNILVLYAGMRIYRHLPAANWIAFVVSYFLLFYIFILKMSHAEPLFLLSLMGLAATARHLRLLAFFWALVISFTVFQPYSWEAAICIFIILSAAFRARTSGDALLPKIMLGAGLAVLFLVLLPVLVVTLDENVRSISAVLREPRVLSAFRTTLISAAVSTVVLIVFGVPFAYALARTRFPLKTFVQALVSIPIVIPQSVAGIALLRVFSPEQPAGELLSSRFGVTVENSLVGICLAQVFVSMPFLLKTAAAAFEAVPERLETAARCLGAPPSGAFIRIALPLASRGILLGAILAWARAVGEFGAVLFIAPEPATLPIEVYNRFESLGVAETAPLVAALVLFSAGMFFLLQLVVKVLPGKETEAGALP